MDNGCARHDDCFTCPETPDCKYVPKDQASKMRSSNTDNEKIRIAKAQKKYREKNMEKYREYQRKYREKNKEKLRQKDKAYRERKKENGKQ